MSTPSERLIPIARLAPKEFERAAAYLIETCDLAGVKDPHDMVVVALHRAFTKRWLCGQCRYDDLTKSAKSFLDGVHSQTDALREVVERNLNPLGSELNPIPTAKGHA